MTCVSFIHNQGTKLDVRSQGKNPVLYYSSSNSSYGSRRASKTKNDEFISSHNNIEQLFPPFGINDTATESLASSTSMEIKKTFDFETTTISITVKGIL